MENLSDIEALALRCRTDEAKSYIAEAIRCYMASAFRAAIVNTWIAVVFDLVDKIRELALSGDAAAKDLETKYEKYIAQIEQGSAQGVKSALEFERNILDLCKEKLQFFDPQQFVDLVRLREDRHRCAHPSIRRAGVPYNASAEQARLHIRNAIVHVLSQPPIQGKAALSELKTLVSSNYFPDKKVKAIAQLQTSALKNATDALVRGFVDQLVFGFVNDKDTLFQKPQAIAALNAAFELYPAIVEKRLTKQLNKAIRDVPDHRISGAARLVAFVDLAWNVAEQASRDKIAEFVTNGPVDEVLGVLGPLAKFEELKLAIGDRVSALTFDELGKAINLHDIGMLGKERALHFLSEAGSWNQVNEAFSKLVLPLFVELDKDDIIRIIRMPTETGADLPGAHGYGLFVEKVRESGVFKDEELNKLLENNGAGYLVTEQEE